MMMIVITTVPSTAEAESLAEALVVARLAACVQILPPMTSVYIWQGTVEKQTEHLLLIKTLPEKYSAVEEFIKANHSYELPEIVAVNAAQASAEYLDWLSSVVKDQECA